MESKTIIFVCTHGNFAEAIIQSAEMIIGPMEDAIPICLQPGMSGDEYLQAVREQVERCKEYNILILADLFGGTPCNTTARLLKDYSIHILTGLNLGMLLEVYSNREYKTIVELKKIAMEALSMSCVDVNEKLGF